MELPSKPFSYEKPRDGWKGLDSLGDPALLPQYTLIFVVDPNNSRVLYGYKNRGFGAHLYNGFGGKPDKDESMLSCARRELEEESGLQVSEEDMIPLGRLVICPPSKSTISISIYGCTVFSGDPQKTEEMTPKWFDIPPGFSVDSTIPLPLPWDQMWPEARLYHPQLIKSILDKSTDQFEGYIEYHTVPPESLDAWRFKDLSPSPEAGSALAGWSFAFVPRESPESLNPTTQV